MQKRAMGSSYSLWLNLEEGETVNLYSLKVSTQGILVHLEN